MRLLTASNAGTSKVHQGCLHRDIAFASYSGPSCILRPGIKQERVDMAQQASKKTHEPVGGPFTALAYTWVMLMAGAPTFSGGSTG